MGNLGGGELLVILMLGLLVLGPSRLAVVVQQVGRLVGQARRLATGFQEEFREIVEDPTLEAAARARGLSFQGPESSDGAPEPEGSDGDSDGPSSGDAPEGEGPDDTPDGEGSEDAPEGSGG